MQPKFTLKKFGTFFGITSIICAFICLFPCRINAQTTITTETATNYTGNSGVVGDGAITFVIENTNGFPITLTKVDAFFDPVLITGVSGTIPSLWYSSTSLSGAPTIATPAWTLLTTGPAVTIPTAGYYNVLSGLSLSIPGGTSYRFAFHSTLGVSYTNTTPGPTPNTLSALGVNLKMGDAQIAAANVGFGGGFPSPVNNPRFFTGRITFTSACTPINATAPVISSVPSTTCAGTPITLSVISGSLNGAASWKWYSGSCGGTLVGTGTSVTVTPLVTTTYFARGEGGCAPAPGACGSQVVTVTPCTCLSPDNSTICSGSVQRIAVNQTGTTTQTSTNATTITISTGAAGPATPYPSVINIAGLPGGSVVSSVTINGLTHTFVEDLDILLRSPSGQNVILMSDVGGFGAASNANLTFSDAGAPLSAGAVVTGTYHPTNLVGTFGVEPDNWPAPGPGTVVQPNPALSLFSGSPNGAWNLYVTDDFAGDGGTITGWSITFTVPNTTAVWTTTSAGTLFSDLNATIPYVAGSQSSVVYAMPTATGANVYTATIASGPCAGANIATVNLLTAPTVTVSPNTTPGACSPATLTASGASIYNWTPTIGLSPTTGPTVIATTPNDAVYSVTGIGANGCTAAPVTVAVSGSPTAAVISAVLPGFSQGWDVASPLPSGWAQQNLSDPGGTTAWFQGNSTTFPSQSGPATSYIAANFQNTNAGAAGTISNWLFTPNVTLTNGDVFSFWTRTTTGTFPDRLQVRMSTNGTSANVGATNASVGDFTNLLLDINPGLTTTGYPIVWTQFNITLSGLAAPVSGRLAFRYFVTNGGGGANSDYIGIDNVSYTSPSAIVCANTTSSIKVDITGGTAPYTLVYSNGTTNTTFNNYTSGQLIQVSPSATTTYTIVSVRSANGCVGSGNTGAATVTVTPPPSITVQPPNRTVCTGQNTTFTVTAGPAIGTTYQWQISTAGGPFTNLANGGVYSGVTTNTLTITGVTTALSGNSYRVVVTGFCPPASVTSTAGTLTVNVPPTITAQPANTTKCVGTTATFSVAAAGNAPIYQWQVSTNSGLSWTDISGATAATLSLAGVAQTMNNNQYRAVVTVGPCGTTATSTAGILTVNALPLVTISAPTLQLIPGLISTITAVSSPAAASYVWTLNGATVAGATGSTLSVNINGIGTYSATVTDVNGCVGSSNSIVIGTAASDHLFVYPNPTRGVFQARLYYPPDGHEIRREIKIFNAQGEVVARKNFDLVRGTTTVQSPYLEMDFDLTKLAAGTYIIKVVEKKNGRIVSAEFIKL